MNSSRMQTSSFYRHRGLLRSPSLSPHILPMYAEALAQTYADDSSSSSSISPSPRRYYDTRVCSYLQLSASESDDM